MIDLVPMDINNKKNIDIINTCYEAFKEGFLKSEKRAKLLGKSIYVPIIWNQYKAEAFWHSSSLDINKNFTIYPCNNDNASTLCNGNCINHNQRIHLKNGEIRNICYYRMARVNWIAEVIELANKNDLRVQIWEKQKKNKENYLYLRYLHKTIDYVLIFAIKPKRYIFVTAFPVFFITTKINFTKDYRYYKKHTKNR